MKITSNFAILDVKAGRKKLAKAINGGDVFLATITLIIDTQHSRDDGTSIEFSGEVLDVKLVSADRVFRV